MALALNSVDSDLLLERFGSSEMLAHGQLGLVSVEAVASRAGKRWASKQDTVWEFAERHFRKEFSPADQIVRLDDVHYMLAQPLENPYGAQGRAINFLRDILNFFLGSSAIADIRVGRVTRIAPGELDHELLTQDEVAHTLAQPRAAPKTSAEDQSGAGRRPPRKTAAGEDAPEIVFVTQPVWAVKKRAVASYRLQPLAQAGARSGEPNGDMAEVTTRQIIEHDLQVLDHAMEILGTERSRRFGLHVPLQIRSLNSIPGRQAVLTRLRASPVDTREAMVICLEGLDAGVPQMVLETAVSVLRPVCLGVVGRAPSLTTDVSFWRGSKLSAVSFDFNDLPQTEHGDLTQALARFVDHAQAVSGTLIGYSLTTRARLLAAWAAGFTHLSGDVLEERVGLPFTPVRFEPANLYKSVPGPA